MPRDVHQEQSPEKRPSQRINMDDVREELRSMLARAEARGAPSVEITAGELHHATFGSATANRMPMCCEAMYQLQKSGDEILYAPPKGRGSRVKIRYQLPRRFY